MILSLVLGSTRTCTKYQNIQVILYLGSQEDEAEVGFVFASFLFEFPRYTLNGAGILDVAFVRTVTKRFPLVMKRLSVTCISGASVTGNTKPQKVFELISSRRRFRLRTTLENFHTSFTTWSFIVC